MISLVSRSLELDARVYSQELRSSLPHEALRLGTTTLYLYGDLTYYRSPKNGSDDAARSCKICGER